MRKETKLLGAMNIAAGLFYVLTASGIILVLYGTGSFTSGTHNYLPINAMILLVIAVALVFLALPGALGGVGIMKNWNWCQTLLLVTGCLNLVFIPIGTILGIYTIYVLMKDERSPIPRAAAVVESKPKMEPILEEHL